MGEAAVKLNDAAGEPVPAKSGSVISSMTWITGGSMVALLVVLGILDYYRYAGPLAAQTMPITWAFNIAPLIVGIVMLMIAMSFGKGGTIRLTWSLFAAAEISIGVGAIIWTVLYTQLGHDPWPSVADFFYTMLYPLEFLALFFAIRGYRGVAKFKTPLMITAAIAVAGFALVYFTVIGPLVLAAASQLPPIGLALMLFNPSADVFLLLAPAVLLALACRALGSGRIAWPWYVVAVSMVAESIADAAYTYMKFTGATNMLVTDVGWLAAGLFLLLGAFVARDVYRS
jgi:hypothetical protein